MPNVATIASKLTLDDAEFGRNIERAEKRAQTFSGKVQSSFHQAFKRGPDVRAERAFSGLFSDLASGNVAQGIEAISSRMTGLGLIAGVAIGAGVAVFVKFKEKIDEATKAHRALEEEMLKHPTSIIANLSMEGMEKALEERGKAADTLREKQQSGLGMTAAELKAGFQSAGAGFGGEKIEDDTERIQAAKDLNQADEDRRKILSDQINLMTSMNRLERMQLTGDEHEAKIGKIILETEQARAALKEKALLQGMSHMQFQRADQALLDSSKMQTDQQEKLKAIKDRAFETQKRQIAFAQDKTKTPDQIKALNAAVDLQSINKNLANPDLSKDERENLILQKIKKEGDLGIMPATVAPMSAEWWRRRQAGEASNSDEALRNQGLSPEDIAKTQFLDFPVNGRKRVGMHGPEAPNQSYLEKYGGAFPEPKSYLDSDSLAASGIGPKEIARAKDMPSAGGEDSVQGQLKKLNQNFETVFMKGPPTK